MKNLVKIIGIILILCYASASGRSLQDVRNEAPTIPNYMVEFLKEKEGYRSLAYRDAVGVWTIGFGHTATARPGMKITPEQGEDLLRKDARRFEKYVFKTANRILKEHQFAALVSFTFNLGYRLKGDLLKGIRNGNDALVTYKMKLYKYAGGRVLRGLVIRREQETQFYNGLESIIKRYSRCHAH